MIFTIEDFDEVYDKLITSKETVVNIDGVDYSLCENENYTLFIKSSVLEEAFKMKVQEYIDDTKHHK